MGDELDIEQEKRLAERKLQRSRNMAAIKGKDTKPEMVVRRYLWSHGYRYRLNDKRLPGKPDLVLRKYRTCIFVNGCFWHGHKVQPHHLLTSPKGEGEVSALRYWCETLMSSECCKIPRTNREFWVKKIVRNRERDIEVQRKLAEMGWHSVTIWECELSTKLITNTTSSAERIADTTNLPGANERQMSTKTRREQTLESLVYTLNHIYLQDRKPRRYEEEDEPCLMVAEEEG